MIINAIHTEQQTIRFKYPIVFTLHDTEKGNYYTEWPVMGFFVEGEEVLVQQKIIEYLLSLYHEYIIIGCKNRDMLMQKRIEALFA